MIDDSFTVSLTIIIVETRVLFNIKSIGPLFSLAEFKYSIEPTKAKS